MLVLCCDSQTYNFCDRSCGCPRTVVEPPFGQLQTRLHKHMQELLGRLDQAGAACERRGVGRLDQEDGSSETGAGRGREDGTCGCTRAAVGRPCGSAAIVRIFCSRHTLVRMQDTYRQRLDDATRFDDEDNIPTFSMYQVEPFFKTLRIPRNLTRDVLRNGIEDCDHRQTNKQNVRRST